MANIGSTLSKYTSASELSNLLESDKAGIYFAKTYLALDGTTDDYDDLYALINTTINGADAEIWSKDGTCLIGSNITIPANIKLKFLNGGILKPASGVTITGSNCKIEAGIHQIFDISAGGILAGTWQVNEIYPDWFSGTTLVDQIENAIDFAIDTNNYNVYFPRIYDITGLGAITIPKQADALDRNVLYLHGTGGGIQKDDAGFIFTATTVATGDINISNMRYVSTEGIGTKVWDCDKIIRIKSSMCDYQNVDTVVSQTSTGAELQSCDFFREHIVGGSGNAFEFYKSYDCSIDKCLFEWRENGIANTQDIATANFNLRIKGNLLEGLTGTAIKLGASEALVIEDNYLEGNEVADIDLYTFTQTNSLYGGSIKNNYINMYSTRRTRNVLIRRTSTAYTTSDYVVSRAASGLLLQCTQAGTTSAGSVTFPTTIGGTVTDGTVVWTAVSTPEGIAGIVVGKIASTGNSDVDSTAFSMEFGGNSCNGELYFKINSGGYLFTSGDYMVKRNLVYERIVFKQGITRFATSSPTVIPDNRTSGIVKGFRVLATEAITASTTTTKTITISNSEFAEPIKAEDIISVAISPLSYFNLLGMYIDEANSQIQLKIQNTDGSDRDATITISVLKIFS